MTYMRAIQEDLMLLAEFCHQLAELERDAFLKLVLVPLLPKHRVTPMQIVSDKHR